MRTYSLILFYSICYILIYLICLASSTNVNVNETHDNTDTTISHKTPLIDLNKSPPKEEEEEDNTLQTSGITSPNQSIALNEESQNIHQKQEKIRHAWRNRKRSSRAKMDPIKKAKQSSKWRLTMINKLHKDGQALIDFRVKRKEAARRQRAAKKAPLAELPENSTKEQKSIMKSTEIPDLNEYPPEETENSQAQKQQENHSIDRTSKTIDNQTHHHFSTQANKNMYLNLKPMKKIKKSTWKSRYASLTKEQKKAYSQDQIRRHREKFNSWPEERKNAFRRYQNEQKKENFAKKGPEALKAANRRYAATHRAKKKLEKAEKAQNAKQN